MEKRLFVIDDDENVVELIKLLFDDLYQVETASSNEVLEHVIQSLPDLILLDVRLHRLKKTGTDICSELKQHPLTKDIPVIFLSAEYRLDELAFRCEADNVLHKPFSLAELKALVFRYMQ